MTRELPSEMATAFATAGTVRGVVAALAEFRFLSGTIGMWTGFGVLDYNDVQYVGGGNLIGISPYEESADLQAKGMTFTLTGVPLNLVSIALQENYQSRLMRLYIAMVDIESFIATEDEPGFVLTEGGDRIKLQGRVNGIYRLFSGLMDKMVIEDTDESATIKLSCENVISLLKRNKVRRYTSEDQKSRYPGDKFFDHMAQLQDKELVW